MLSSQGYSVLLFSEGKQMAIRYDSKYIEVSAIINLKVSSALFSLPMEPVSKSRVPD